MSETVPFLDPEEVPSTHQINFVAGAFASGAWRIPFFVSTLSFKQAAADLSLTSDLPASQTASFGIDELFQRDVDWARVEGPLLQYLLSENEPQFFNAITVTLMPFDDSNNQSVEAFDSSVLWKPPGLIEKERYQEKLEVGPISFGFFSKWTSPLDREFSLGRMRWNKDQVHAVAIDGQHRLATIKKLDSMNQQSKSVVPVIFLIFDERVGFSSPDTRDMTQMMRKMFIDLNKHAKTVSRARQILLDDRDPFSRCARTLVSNCLAPDLNAVRSDEPTLPLSLVDWHTEQAKFDSGPYLTTVLAVEWIMGLVLNQKQISDYEAYSKFESQISSFEYRLGIDLSGAKQNLELSKSTLTPFSYSEEDLSIISRGFQETWNEALIHLFTEFSPYKDFLRLRESAGTTSIQWQWWFKLKKAAESGAEEAQRELSNYLLELRHAEPVVPYGDFESQLTDVENFKEGNLAFNVVFQRAYFAAFQLFKQFEDADLAKLEDWNIEAPVSLDELTSAAPVEVTDEASIDGEDSLIMGESPELHKELARARQFVSAMNFLFEKYPELSSISAKLDTPEGSVPIWDGSLRQPHGGIDFTQAAGTRAADLLFLWATLATTLGRGTGEDGFDEFWSEVENNSDKNQAFKKLMWSYLRLRKDEKSVAGRILSTKEQEYSQFAADEEIKKRLRGVWALVNR